MDKQCCDTWANHVLTRGTIVHVIMPRVTDCHCVARFYVDKLSFDMANLRPSQISADLSFNSPNSNHSCPARLRCRPRHHPNLRHLFSVTVASLLPLHGQLRRRRLEVHRSSRLAVDPALSSSLSTLSERLKVCNSEAV
ncbi:hypothetical protein PIB30_030059 [Stylosanthes scabra]|uniref:Uncharacterized protein n=1 Tax=Stylosanthes scabra TaxID=79078 RepID=A0ABU6UE44_9FABA|nr:hypothetical protein [Stylosanthes scabra]